MTSKSDRVDVAGVRTGETPAAPSDDKDRLTLYYDGSCPLCSAEIKHYKAQPGGDRLAFVDVSRAENAVGAGLTARQAMRRFHVRQSDGSLLSGARAFIAIWKELPRWRWAARIATIPGIPTLLEGLYRLFLPVRPFLSKAAALFGAKPETPCPRDK